ncbi:MAG TPA: hypothetical protein VH855_13665 [Acetobacteraceae bacterium]|jgi:hypothetical protein
MAWFLNQYVRETCEGKWEDGWSATCDDDCPRCGARHMVPYRSIDLTEIIVEDDDTFVVLRSPDAAEDSPDYDVVTRFATREEAEAFLKHGDDSSIGAAGFVE